MADIEHALAFMVGSAGRYRDEYDKMPDFLREELHELLQKVWYANTHYATWLVESAPEHAPDFLLKREWPWCLVDPKDSQSVYKQKLVGK